MTITSRPNQLPLNPGAVFSSPLYRAYTGAVADRNLVTVGGACCRAIRCTTAGDLVVTDADGTSVTLPFLAGETMLVQAATIVASGSTATGLVVFW